VKTQIEAAILPIESDEEWIARLANLAPTEYERVRKGEAERHNWRVKLLDAEVAKHRPQSLAQSSPKKDEVEPWPDPVDGPALLSEIREVYQRFVVMPPYAADALALYTLNSYVAAECFYYCPIVLVVSPEHECGKGRVLDVAQALCRNTFRTANTSAPVLYRLVGDCEGRTTLLVDEMDSQPDEQRAAIGNVLKSGFEKSGKSHRLEKDGDKMKMVEFSTYCPKICAAISIESFDRPTVSRSIIIRMKKKTRAERVSKFRRYDGTDIRRKCLRWAMDNAERLRSMPIVQFPDEMCSDRQEDIWEPLIWIAQLCDPDWTTRTWRACAGLTGGNRPAAEDTKHSVLRLCCEYAARHVCDHVRSQELVAHLNGLEDVDIKDWRKGQGISQAKLAAILSGYEIYPTQFHADGKVVRGYSRTTFQDAAERYLGQDQPLQGATVLQNQCLQGNDEHFQSATVANSSGLEKAIIPKQACGCSTVAPSKPEPVPAELVEADLI
jgi:putative DNA primase/helicase